MKRETKDRIKDIISVVSPKFGYRLLKNRTLKTYKVVNDLEIKPVLKREYDPAGTYVTMHDFPQKIYDRINAERIFDENGVPLFLGKYYNAVQIAQYGLTEYGYFVHTKNEKHLANAKNACRYFLENQEEKTGYFRYNFEFYHRATGITLNNWACAMGQGQAASLLTRMWRIEKDDRMLENAKNAFNMFDVPVEDGGLKALFDGYTVFEEYPTTPASFTLNGMIFASFGLYDCMTVMRDDRISYLWDTAVKTIEYMVPFYDGDITCSYDLSHITARVIPRVKADKYHMIHINLLQNMQSVAPSPTYEYYIRKWAGMSGFKIKEN